MAGGGSSSQSANTTASQMATGWVGCQAISIIITHKARNGQKVKGWPLQICHPETPGKWQMFVSLSACVTSIYFM